MRILLLYDPSPGTIGEYFQRAFAQLGHEVEHVAMSQAGRCRDHYDFYLRIDHGDYSCDFPDALHPNGFYIVDAHLRKSWRSIHRQAPSYDLVFCAQQRAAQLLPRAFWVPMACDPELHRGQMTGKRYDLAFVGRDGGVPRKFYLQELRERYPCSYIGQAPHTEMATIYSQAKIGFHYIECTSPLKDMVSMRVYEVLAAGTLLLTNDLAPGALEAVGLRNREHLVIYRSPTELFRLIDYYLKHDEERQQIAAAGQAIVLSKHTYRHRAQHIFNIIQQQRG